MAISRTGFGSEGLSASALTRSQLALPKVGSCNLGFPGPSKVPSSRMATNPLNLLAMPSRVVVEGALFRGEVSWRDQRQTHGDSSISGRIRSYAAARLRIHKQTRAGPAAFASALDARHRGIVERIEEYLRRYAGGGNLELVEA